jgi:peptide chain release factor 2
MSIVVYIHIKEPIMLFDDLQEQLKNLEPDIQTIKTFWANAAIEEKISNLELQAQDPSVWQDPKKSYILKDLQALKNQKELFEEIITNYSDAQDILQLFKDDESEIKKLENDIESLGGSVRSFKIQLLLNEPDDRSNCYLSINPGAGGTESQDWAEMISRMYIRFCEKNRLEASVLDYQAGDEAGIKSVTLLVKGKNAYGLLKSEHGTHRLVRISPYDSNKRRHTSFAGVFVIPEMAKVEIAIDPKDLRIDTYRASGAGGQHVNKTDSAVRITHQPTGIVVQCQNQRSQLQNKESCMKMLKAKLVQRQKEEEQAKSDSVEKKKIEWGSQIRSYVLHPYKMVKDHRTSHESSQPDMVLDGDLIKFIEAYLIS